MKELFFKKTNDKWYIDIPYDGDMEDLEMVYGADTFLESIAYGNETVKLKIHRNQVANAIVCTKIDETEVGSTYIIDNWDCMECSYNGTIWLCNVTLMVLGGFPEYIYITL